MIKKIRKLRPLTIAFSILIFACAAAAQTRPSTTGTTAPQTGASIKIAVINPRVFSDPKSGITKYVNALNSVNAEFKTSATEMDAMANRINALQTEINTLRGNQSKNVPVDARTLNLKLEEYEKLGREYKFKKEGTETSYNRRRDTVLNPIRLEIGNAIQEYAKKNGYVVVLDLSKLYETGLLLGYDEKADITKDFINFYNARPATAAAPTTR